MKKIYFIDYISPNGHIGFNRIQIKALLNLGFFINGIFREGYYEKIDINNPYFVNYLSIPHNLFRTQNNILRRIELIKRLKLIHKSIPLDKNDIVIFSCYETISLCLAPKFGEAYIIDHMSVVDLDSTIKKVFFKHLPISYHHVVFNKYIANRLNKDSIDSIIIPHGFTEKLQSSTSETVLNKYFLKPQKYIFSPSPSSVDRLYLETICNDPDFNLYLDENKLKFVLRGKYTINKIFRHNYILINGYMEYQDYISLFVNALSIIVCYPDNFKYRVSAVLFESMAYNVPFLLKNNESLNHYSSYSVIANDINWNNSHDLIASIKKIQVSNRKSWYNDLSNLSDPSKNWEKVLI